MNPPLPTANLKNTKHINLVFSGHRDDRELLREFLDWLVARSTQAVSDTAKRAHLDELERRRSGKNFVTLSTGAGVSLRDLGAMPIVLKHFSYARIQRQGFAVSFDVLNAANELEIGDNPGSLTLELFIIDGRRPISQGLVALALEAIRDWPVSYAFGGSHTFTADYALAHAYFRSTGTMLLTNEFLWPFVFDRHLARISDEALRALPAFRTGRESGGSWIWLFEDLSIGHNDDYVAAAEALGLRTIWSLHAASEAAARFMAGRRTKA
jgi:hypothetical protein